jgi:Ca-activated chloride channel family protein
MIFWNLNFSTIIIFILLFIIWIVFLFLIYRKSNNKWIILLFLSFLFLIINIFEIKWWFNENIEKIEWWNIVFILDVSKSMNSLDIKNNNKYFSRLNTSKDLIKNYISKNSNNNYWLIIFAWEALEVLPFTSYFDIFNTILFWINNSNISKSWTNLNSVFDSLENYFVWNNIWWLAVIFTDGWDEKISINDEQLLSLKNKWVKIILVWVGSEKWAEIPIWKDLFWMDIYKLYNWEKVITKLNNNELNNISKNNNIDYIVLDNINDFDKINSYITKNINLIDIEKSINYRLDLTRIMILISFIFFILFLIFENIIWRKK